MTTTNEALKLIIQESTPILWTWDLTVQAPPPVLTSVGLDWKPIQTCSLENEHPLLFTVLMHCPNFQNNTLPTLKAGKHRASGLISSELISAITIAQKVSFMALQFFS